MCVGGGESYKPTPTPSAVPGTTNVSSGKAADSETVQSRYIEKMRRRQGFNATIKNEGGAAGLTGGAGKETLG